MKKRQRTVLIVDDESTMLKVLEKKLVLDGYRVINALNGMMAIQKAKEEIPDLIVSDLMMPQISGQEMAKQLNKDSLTQEIPIIFITSTMGVENDKGDEQMDIDGKYYRIFAKPVHERKLLSTIRKTINRRENN